jgi:hypothetical protein
VSNGITVAVHEGCLISPWRNNNAVPKADILWLQLIVSEEFEKVTGNVETG